MNSDNLPQLLKTGFHLTLGAASFAIETLQSPIEREKNLAKLQSDLGLLADELLEKGETIDREARNYVDSVFGEQFGEQRENEKTNDSEFASDIQSDTQSDRTSEQQSDKPADKSPEPFTGSDVRLEIQELTAQMAALRVELESLRAENSEQG
jgi:polyhydroxyalkanoate synthesis regulator phasin